MYAGLEDCAASGRELNKEEVMKVLTEQMGIPQTDIDFVFAHFGDKCLVSVEKFFEFKDRKGKRPRGNRYRYDNADAHTYPNKDFHQHPDSQWSQVSPAQFSASHVCTSRSTADMLSASADRGFGLGESKVGELKGNNSGQSDGDTGYYHQPARTSRWSSRHHHVKSWSGYRGRNSGCQRWTKPEDAEMNNALKWDIFEEGAEIKEHLEKHGLKDVSWILQKHLDGWKNKPLNIAVTGMSGKGKSSLINALRNMNERDYGAAKVGEEECTKVCRPYPHPEHSNFVFWDVPGAGTPLFPKETYLQKICVDRYDFFMIVSSERFSDIDSWLAKEIKRRNKRFYFIRTKIDVDMENVRRRTEDSFDEDKEFASLKNTIQDKLTSDFGDRNFHFFMVSNNYPHKYDFPFLLHQLLQDVPHEKKLALVFGIAGMSKQIIEEKASALKSRVWKCALVSGAAAAIPVPVVSKSIDMGIILKEVLFYRHQFALDEVSLGNLARMTRLSLHQLKKNVDFKTSEALFTSDGLSKYLEQHTAGTGTSTAGKMVKNALPVLAKVGKVGGNVANYVLPAVGITISCGMAFASTMSALQNILEMMKEDAINTIVYVTRKKTRV